MVLEVEARIGRNVRLYPWYALAFNAYFWMPIFVLYFLQFMPLADVLRLEAIYYMGVVVLEVPSGYFSDRVGRRVTLLLASAFLIAAYALFFLGSTFSVFAVAQVLLAAGLAFNSGTDTSLHFDSLASLGRESEYADREASAARNSLLASGVGGVMGGAAGLIDLRLAYALSVVGAVISFALVLAMHEPRSHERTLTPPGPVRQFMLCAGRLRDHLLGWTFAYAIAMTILNHIPYEFYQPYMELALARFDALGRSTPLTAGLHMGIVMFLASGVAGRSVAIRDRLGYANALLLATLLQVAIVVAMGLVLHPLVLLLVLLRSFPRAMASAPMNAAVTPRVGREQRATFLSLQSLAGRLAFSASLVGLSFARPLDGVDSDWARLSVRLLISGAAGTLMLGVLWISRPRPKLKARPSNPAAGH